MARAPSVLGARIADGLAVAPPGPPLLPASHPRAAGRPSPSRTPAARRRRRRCWPWRAAWAATTCSSCSLSGGASALLPGAGGRRDARGEGGPHRPAHGGGGDDRRAEHRAQAPLAAQGRRPGAGGRARARRLPRPLGRGRATTSSTIASGPTVPDPTTYADARRRCSTPRGRSDAPLRPPPSPRGGRARRVAGDAQARRRPSSARVRTRLIGSNAIERGRRRRGRRGGRACARWSLTTRLEGEAREVARVAGGRAARVRGERPPAAPPVCLLAGGETTVTVRGDGRGGRNQEIGGGGGGRAPRRLPGARRWWPAWPPTASTARARPRGASPTGDRRARGGAGPGPAGRVPGRQRLHELPRPPGRSHRDRTDRHQRGGPHGPAGGRRAPRAGAR